MKVTARHVKVSHDAQTLTIVWGDGHESVYPLDGLRRECPCATCQGGHENMRDYFLVEVFRLPVLQHWEVRKMEAIGRHALRITWDDGHNAGMYRWSGLREACPCETCYTKRPLTA